MARTPTTALVFCAVPQGCDYPADFCTDNNLDRSCRCEIHEREGDAHIIPISEPYWTPIAETN